MKQITIITAVLIVLYTSCKNLTIGEAQFGKGKYELDKYDFDIDIPKFYRDETLFGDTSKYKIRAVEIELERKDSSTMFVAYQMDDDDDKNAKNLFPATYEGVDFNTLNVISSWDDKSTYMISAKKYNCKPEEFNNLVNLITKKFNTPLENQERYYGYSPSITWEKEGKIAQLKISNDNFDFNSFGLSEETGSSDYIKEIEESVQKAASVDIMLFITIISFNAWLSENPGGYASYEKYDPIEAKAE